MSASTFNRCRDCKYAAAFHVCGSKTMLGCYEPRVLDMSRGYPTDPKLAWMIVRADSRLCGVEGQWFEMRAA